MSPTQFNFQKILNLKDVERGLKKLNKKKQYKDIYDPAVLVRYLEIEKREKNSLRKFLQGFKKNGIFDPLKIQEYYSSLKSFQLDPFEGIAIPKENNPQKFRPLLVPTPKDRLLFDSLYDSVFKNFKDMLLKRNLLGLGLVKKQRISEIILRVYHEYIQKGYLYVLILDYSNFFSLIDQKNLIRKMRKDKINNNFVEAIKFIISNKINNGLEVEEKTGVPITQNGIPQGLAFSPLLASYYVVEIDDIYLNNKDVVGFRYIDDIIILGKSDTILRNIYKKIKSKSDDLRMALHPLGKKTQLKFLGKEHFTYLGVDISQFGIQISEEKFDNFIKVLREEIFSVRARREYSVENIKKIYYRFVRGWLNHYQKVVDKPVELHNKLDRIIEKFFLKDKFRKGFLRDNKWIYISGNTDITK